MSFKSMLYEFIYDVPMKREVTKFQCVFTTVDGKEHVYNGLNWMETAAFVNPIKYLCGIPKKNGFLLDDDRIAYPLGNVLSYKYIPIGTGYVINKNKFRNFFPDDEVIEKTLDERTQM